MVRQELEKREMTQAELAQVLGIERANLNRVLTGRSGKVPTVWQGIFDELGFKVIIIPADGDSRQKHE
ncbi:helix-turn-helix domain-containing protein [Deinococcus sp. SL84]|uniref:helix-turn-helix domain-containing protein n=1 Tax=Deinococcus sp. SL84 TaxID=2994663 RepID=UPI002DD44DFB|nr:helix-turn-helix domain-containing protein [Deinococcus sp. SL84]